MNSSKTQYYEMIPGDSANSRSSLETHPDIFDILRGFAIRCELDETWMPRRFALSKDGIKAVVKKTDKPRTVIDWYPRGFVANESLGRRLKEICGDDIQLCPLSLVWPNTYKVHHPAYYYINIISMIDCINITLSRIVCEPHSLPEELSQDITQRSLVLDPNLIPPNAQIFYTRYFWRNPIVSKEAFLVMRDEFPDVFAFQQCILKTEPAIERSRRLDSLISQAKSNYISARSDPHKRIDESSLGLMLSDKLIKLLAQSSNLVDLEVDLYDHIKAIESTLRLREWKELDWPMHLVCISEDGRGGYFALDLSKNKDGDCPVVYFDHELAKIDKKTGRITPQFEVAAKTFSAWIKRLKRGGSAML